MENPSKDISYSFAIGIINSINRNIKTIRFNFKNNEREKIDDKLNLSFIISHL